MNALDVTNEAKCKSLTSLSILDTMLIRLDDPELFAGAPAALQIVGPKWGDEQLLKDVEIIDLVLNSKSESDAAKSSSSKL